MTSEEANNAYLLSILLRCTTVDYSNSPNSNTYCINGWTCRRDQFMAVKDWLERNGRNS